jgi:post-segregation antitoxin (ccd killing protein)
MTTEENSVELELKLKLPGSLVQEARASGLLTSQALETLLREEVRRRRVAQLFDAADRLAALPPLTEAEVEAEIQAARAERRSSYEKSRRTDLY